jgi:hypothetical protein
LEIKNTNIINNSKRVAIKMKSWTPEHTKEIKEWFTVENYHKFEALSLKAYYHGL